MSYSYKCYSDTKDIMKKYVNAVEGAAIYGLGKTRIMALAKEAGAVYKVGNSALINTEIFESYLESSGNHQDLYLHIYGMVKRDTIFRCKKIKYTSVVYR